MAGTGYFGRTTGVYRPLSVETWDDYTSWDSFTGWTGTPVLPLEFTTAVTDYGSSTLLNFSVEAETSDPFTTTISYSDTVDSAGALISPSTVTITPNTSSISAIKARYWQFKITIDADSAGALTGPDISSITTSLSEETVTRTLTDIDSSSLGGSVGLRELPTVPGISGITSLIAQPHAQTADYVAAGYVDAGYAAQGLLSIPVVLIEKSTPVILHIYDAELSNSPADCVFDALITGLPAITSNGVGNISIET